MKIKIRIPLPKPTKWHTHKKGNKLYTRKVKHRDKNKP